MRADAGEAISIGTLTCRAEASEGGFGSQSAGGGSQCRAPETEDGRFAARRLRRSEIIRQTANLSLQQPDFDSVVLVLNCAKGWLA